MKKRISDMMDGFTEEVVNIASHDDASSERIKEAVMTRIHTEEKHKQTRRSRSLTRVAALAAVFILATGGSVYALAGGGLTHFLSLLMPDKEISARLDSPSENSVTIVQSEGEDYGQLWTLEEYWYDGAILYFTARAPQKIVDDGNMIVEWRDHADVNGTDCLLSADGCWDENSGKYTGQYTCWVNLSEADISSETVTLTIRLELNKYDEMPVFFSAPENYTMETIAKQKLAFTFENSSDMRQMHEENLSVEGGNATVSVTAAPSLFDARIVYRMKDSSLPINDIAKYKITDATGKSITVWVNGIVETEDGEDMIEVLLTNLEGLDPYSESYNFEPLCVSYDPAGEIIPETFNTPDWGRFTVELR